MSEEENRDAEKDIKLKDEADKGFSITVNDNGPMRPNNQDQENSRIVIAPALPLSGMIVFPFALSPLVLTDPNSIKTIESAVSEERLVAFFPEMPKENDRILRKVQGIEFTVGILNMNGQQVSATGILVRIVKMLKFPDGTVRVLVRGISRIQFRESVNNMPYLAAKVEKLTDAANNSIEISAMVRNAAKQFQEVASFTPNFPEELKIAIMNLNDNSRVADLIADTLNFSYIEKLSLLTIRTLQERLHLLTILLNREVEVLRLGSQIQNQVHSVMSKSQREFFLREQLKQIKAELGEGDKNPDIADIKKRMEGKTFPKEVKDVLDKELGRLDLIPQASGEYNIAYTYIDWLLSVPWNEFTEDRLDVKKAAEILDHDHYGLKDVKERILETLSVLQLKNNKKAPIICFVGPPGVGKTSLGKSIASAMGRKFIRMSLGGIKDEAEIRGHRRTYIGALPGRIIQGMKKAGSSNPVFMLDELDKVGGDYRGDPASALLEVLDPQQNSAFNDHYLEVDYDLSSVMFIATANLSDPIPGPLLDRMEVIRLPGYTAMEKLQIAKQYLVPRQITENGLTHADLNFTKKAVDEIITHYTMEAGVRNLERIIGSVCRKFAKEITDGKVQRGTHVIINAEYVKKLLGPEKILKDETEDIPQIGVVTGMAWTSVGGSTLQVEALKMPGRGELKLTGSLGDVMKESAAAAFSYVRCHAKELGIAQSVFKKNDFHIHVPDGATPKDGPSAGVTLTTAIVSLLTEKPVRTHLSMTGEITLRGKVTAVGGIREKVIAAMRAGVKDIIMPAENEKDLTDVPDEVKKHITFHFAKEIHQVLDFALPKVMPKKGKNALKTEDDEIFTYTEDEKTEPTQSSSDNSKEGSSVSADKKEADGEMPQEIVNAIDGMLDSYLKDPEAMKKMQETLAKHDEEKNKKYLKQGIVPVDDDNNPLPQPEKKKPEGPVFTPKALSASDITVNSGLAPKTPEQPADTTVPAPSVPEDAQKKTIQAPEVVPNQMDVSLPQPPPDAGKLIEVPAMFSTQKKDFSKECPVRRKPRVKTVPPHKNTGAKKKPVKKDKPLK